MARRPGRIVAALALAGALILAAAASAAERTPSDAEIDAQLFVEVEGAPHAREMRKLVAELEPKLWAHAREIVRRALDERDDARRDALLQKFLTVEASARNRAMLRFRDAPLAALDDAATAWVALFDALESRSPEACAGHVWPPSSGAEVEAATSGPAYAVELALLRASRAARDAPTVWPKLDEETGRRIRDAFRTAGVSDAEIDAYSSIERPVGLDDAALCALVRRIFDRMRRLPDELRGAYLANAMDRGASPDDFGADAERLFRIPTMSDAEIDAALTNPPVGPGAAAIFKLLAERDPTRLASIRSVVRARFRPIDDDDFARTAEATAFSVSVGDLKAAIARAPLADLDAVARSALDALRALIRVKDGRDACTRIGEYWIYDGDAGFAAEKIPAETARFVEASAAALHAAQRAPVVRPPMDAQGYDLVRQELAKVGYAEPGTGSQRYAIVPGPTEEQGGWCGWKADYYAALLRLPDAVRERALAFEMSRTDADP